MPTNEVKTKLCHEKDYNMEEFTKSATGHPPALRYTQENSTTKTMPCFACYLMGVTPKSPLETYTQLSQPHPA